MYQEERDKLTKEISLLEQKAVKEKDLKEKKKAI